MLRDTLAFAVVFFGLVGCLCWVADRLARWAMQRDYDRLLDEYRWME